MRKGMILILGLIVITLIILGCGEKKPDCTKLKTAAESNQCYMIEANESLSFEPCKHIADETRRRGCQAEVVKSRMTRDLCDSLINAREKDYCNMYVGIYSKNEYKCDSIINLAWRDQCYVEVVMGHPDISTCEKIQQKNMKDVCIKVFEKG